MPSLTLPSLSRLHLLQAFLLSYPFRSLLSSAASIAAMAERGPEGLKGFLPEKRPSKSQVLTVVAVFPIGGLLLILSGVTLTASVVGLAVATPLFLLFSPVLVPAAIAIGLAMTGFLASGAFCLTGLSSLSRFMEEARRLLSKASDQLEQVRRQTMEAAGTKEAAQGMQGRT